MPTLEPYSREKPISYALGLFPAMEALRKAPDQVSRVLLHSSLGTGEGAENLIALCDRLKIRTEEADRALRRLSGKDNCFAAAVFRKTPLRPEPESNHLVLVNPMDAGNLGTILRTALGLGYRSIALVRPCADPFEPRVVRAGMGAVFSLRLSEYDSFEQYRKEYPRHALYPFMLDGSLPMSEAAQKKQPPFILIFGNEGSGLSPSFAHLGSPVRIEQTVEVDSLNLAVAAALGMYAFRV